MAPTCRRAISSPASISSWDGRRRRARSSRRRVAQAPGRPQFLALLGEAERQSKNPQRAVELARQALRADAGFAQARYYLALALFDLGQRDEAIGELEQVVAARAAAGRSVSESGQRVSRRRTVRTRRLAVLGAALKIDPGRADVHIQLARAYRLKNLTAARRAGAGRSPPRSTSNAASSGYDAAARRLRSRARNRPACGCSRAACRRRRRR